MDALDAIHARHRSTVVPSVDEGWEAGESGSRGAHLRDVDDTRAILDVLIRDARLDPLLDPGDRLLEWWTGRGAEVRWLSIRSGDGFGRREVRGAHPRRTLFFFAASAFSLVGSLNGPPIMFACGLTSSVPRATVWTPDEASLITKASRGRVDFAKLRYGASWPKSSEAFHWRQSPGAHGPHARRLQTRGWRSSSAASSTTSSTSCWWTRSPTAARSRGSPCAPTRR